VELGRLGAGHRDPDASSCDNVGAFVDEDAIPKLASIDPGGVKEVQEEQEADSTGQRNASVSREDSR
jgi:hypothetical protein